MEAAIGPIGIAIGLAAAVWTTFKSKQEEARKKAAEHLKIQTELLDAIKDGNAAVAASKFIEIYGDIIDRGRDAGQSANEVVDFIRDTGDASADAKAKMADLDRQIADLQTTYDDLTAAAQKTGQMTSDATAVGNKLTDLKEHLRPARAHRRPRRIRGQPDREATGQRRSTGRRSIGTG